MAVIKTYCLIFIILIFLGCEFISSNNPQEVYFKYYNFFDNICNFLGYIEVQDEKSNAISSIYQINYSKTSGCSIVNKVEKDFFRTIEIDNGTITITAKNGISKVYIDSEENRLNLGIPPGFGINPYYFLDTDLTKSKIRIFGENIEITYSNNKINLKEYIKISNNKIDRIQIFFGNDLIQEIRYYDFKKISSNIYYPMKYIQSFFNKKGAIIKNVKVVYRDVRIKLCK